MGRTLDSSSFDAVLGNLYIEVKHEVRAIRALRSSLIQLAYHIRGEPPQKAAALVLVNSSITDPRLSEEWEAALDTLRPEVAGRLRLLRYKEGRWRGFPNDPDSDLQRKLEPFVHGESGGRVKTVRGEAYFEILKILIHAFLIGRGPLSAEWLSEVSGTSYPTVSGAVRRLGSTIRRHSNRSIELKYFPRDEWARLVATSDRNRSTLRYADRSGQQRSTQSLLRRFEKLQRPDIAIGGVVGVRHYYPGLDLVGLPSLDVTVHAQAHQPEVSFVESLDPGLALTEDRYEPAVLRLHFLRRKDPFFEGAQMKFADPVECLLDLHESHLERQAKEFLTYLLDHKDKS